MKKLFFIALAKKEVIGIIYRKAVYFFEIMLFAMTICLADILCGCERKEVSTDNGEETVEKQRKKRHFLHLMTDQAVLRKSILIFWTVRA